MRHSFHEAEGTKDMLYQMFLRKFFNGKHDITEAEASFVATKKFVFWLKRIASAMAKTKAMCIINRSSKLISIQHEKNRRNMAEVVKTVPLILMTELILNMRLINQ